VILNSVTAEGMWDEVVVRTQDARQSGEDVRGLRMQCANALTVTPRLAPDAHKPPQGRGQKIPDSTDVSQCEHTHSSGWIAVPRMVIRLTPSICPDQK